MKRPETENRTARAPRDREGPRRQDRLWVLLKRFDRCRFFFFHVEHGVQLGDLQQVVDLLGQVQQFELAALVANGGEGADQLADARAVDVGNVAQG